VVVVNPAQVRHYAKALGERAKTDPVDARVIAQFVAAIQPEIRMLADEAECASARTFAFRARPEDMAALRAEVLDLVRRRSVELEAAAAHDPAARSFALYMGSTPVEPEGEG
jgi:transposase